MTKGEIVQAVVDRGFNYETNSVIGGFVERAYQTICARYPWPFLEATTTGVGSVEIPDLRRVLSVSANEEPLTGVDRRWIARVPNLAETGTASYWYLENQTLKVFPVDTATVTIRYAKIPAVLAEGDTPLIPTEWQYLIVDRAIVDCLKSDDEYDEARALKGDVEEGIREMVGALLNRDYQGPRLIVRTGRVGDYL